MTGSHLVLNGNWKRVHSLMMHYFQVSFLAFRVFLMNVNLIIQEHFKVLVKEKTKVTTSIRDHTDQYNNS